MKLITILFCLAFFFAGCSKEDSKECPESFNMAGAKVKENVCVTAYIVNCRYASQQVYGNDSVWDGEGSRELSVGVVDTLTVVCNWAPVELRRITSTGLNELRYHAIWGNYNHYTIIFYKNDPDSITGAFYEGGRFGGVYKTALGRKK